jgi:hypothetical protein
LPAHDFEVKVEASFQPLGNDRLGIALFSDDQNYFELAFHASRDDAGSMEIVPSFERRDHGQSSPPNPKVKAEEWNSAAAQRRHIWLKIERNGAQYSGSYAYAPASGEKSDKSPSWIPVGTLAWIGFQGKLELFSCNHFSEQEGNAEFYSVEIWEPKLGESALQQKDKSGSGKGGSKAAQ